MVIQGKNDHARLRVIAILVGLEVAVSRVNLNVKGQCVDVWAEHPVI